MSAVESFNSINHRSAINEQTMVMRRRLRTLSIPVTIISANSKGNLGQACLPFLHRSIKTWSQIPNISHHFDLTRPKQDSKRKVLVLRRRDQAQRPLIGARFNFFIEMPETLRSSRSTAATTVAATTAAAAPTTTASATSTSAPPLSVVYCFRVSGHVAPSGNQSSVDFLIHSHVHLHPFLVLCSETATVTDAPTNRWLPGFTRPIYMRTGLIICLTLLSILLMFLLKKTGLLRWPCY